MRGTILILGNARITTGMLLNDKVAFNYKTKEIEYTLDKNAIGRIGDGARMPTMKAATVTT